jgi:hypothetical protein
MFLTLTTAKNTARIRDNFMAISSFIFYIDLTIHQNSSTVFHTSTERVDDHADHWIKFHDTINPVSKQPSKLKTRGPTSISTAMAKPAASEMEKLESLASIPNQQKVPAGINKMQPLQTTKTPVPKKESLVKSLLPLKVRPPYLQHTLHIIDSLQTAR